MNSSTGYIRNTPHLYIRYIKEGEDIKLGPFFTASFDGASLDWTAYMVQDAKGRFYRITVPHYHTLSSILTPEGFDIY